MSTYSRLMPFGAIAALLLAAACSSSSNGGGGGGQPDSSTEGGGSDAGEDVAADTGGGDTGTTQDASEGGSTSDSPADSPAEASGGDGGPCDPSSLGSSLVLWLEGDMGLATSGSPASLNWADQSGTMPPNNATSDALPNPPTVDMSAVNGHAAVKFDGTNSMFVPDATSLQWGTGPFAVMLVMSDVTQTADAAATAGFTIFTKLHPTMGSSIGLGLQLFPGGLEATDYVSHQVRANTTTIADGNFHVIGAIRAGGVLQVRIDGAMAASGAFAVDVSSAMQAIALGVSPNLSPPAFAGDIAEVIAVNGTVADPACLESYLKAKYGL